MVVGADVEAGVGIALVPHQPSAFHVFVGGQRRSGLVLQVGQQPASRDDRVCFQQFGRSRGAHLAGDDGGQVCFDRDNVDCRQASVFDEEAEGAAKALVFVPLPVEADADGDLQQVESVCGFVIGGEQQFVAEGAAPADAPLVEDGGLPAADRDGIGVVRAVQHEVYPFAAQDAYLYARFIHGFSFKRGLEVEAAHADRICCFSSSKSAADGHTSLSICRKSAALMRSKSFSMGRMNTPPMSTDAGLHSRRPSPGAS